MTSKTASGQQTRPPLSDALSPEGRSIWEPPIFDYSHLIGEEYERKRESVMKYTSNNVVRTTKIMDLQAEKNILWMYACYLNTAIVDSQTTIKPENVTFYEGLWNEVFYDFEELQADCKEDDVSQRRQEDGTWKTTEVVWVTKSFDAREDGEEIKKIDPYISAHNARLAAVRKDVLPLPEILAPDDFDTAWEELVWDFEPLGADIAVPEVMCMIFQGKLKAAYGGKEEDINGNEHYIEDLD